jgi:hypothetical protein
MWNIALPSVIPIFPGSAARFSETLPLCGLPLILLTHYSTFEPI